MNIIVGMMMPGDELGAEAGARTARRSLRGSAASTSRWRPNTLTSAWPVKVSSICALSTPVCRHCAMNCFCERLAIDLASRASTAGP